MAKKLSKPQRLYGKGRHDGIITGIFIGIFSAIAFLTFNKQKA